VIIVGIDPGSSDSGVVGYNSKNNSIEFSAHMSNNELIENLRGNFTIKKNKWDLVAIEDIECMMLKVGKTTFDTCKWIGRFQEAYRTFSGKEALLISRGDEKIVICGCKTFVNPETGSRCGILDKHIRLSLIEMFPETGGGRIPQIGTKKQPGPLYGMSNHTWSALSVAITALEISKDKKKGIK